MAGQTRGLRITTRALSYLPRHLLVPVSAERFLYFFFFQSISFLFFHSVIVRTSHVESFDSLYLSLILFTRGVCPSVKALLEFRSEWSLRPMLSPFFLLKCASVVSCVSCLFLWRESTSGLWNIIYLINSSPRFLRLIFLMAIISISVMLSSANILIISL